MRHITLITTGGTIEKTYDEQTGSLENRRSIVRKMLRRLRLEETTVSCIELMSKDSLVMTEDDRRRVVEAVRAAGGTHEFVTETTGVVILHGTDTLSVTGERLCGALGIGGAVGGRGEKPTPLPPPSGRGGARVPIVLTGAWRPYEMTRSDALQNLTEAIFATGVLAPGVYAAAHGRVLPFPGVVKDRERGTFVKTASG